MRWFRNFYAQHLFNTAFERCAKEKVDAGEITYDEYADCMKAVKDKKGMRRARRQMQTDPNMLGGISDIDWNAILKWFQDYFIPAMKFIIPIVLMIL